LDLTGFHDKIQIVYVPGKNFLIPQKKLTMVFHMILPLIYAIKCLFKYQPDVFYDTTGFASTLFLTKILLPTTKTTAYVHYPFISLDMIQKVKERRSDFNNDSR
jgi:alpha-1,2-mannosyltransferase